jgi:iron complex transport system substrate-binding protein
MFRFIIPFVVVCLGCIPPAEPPAGWKTPPQRIISTLPSITEVLFELGLQDRIVGDSSSTKYPPEAATIEKIGGLYDINREKIVSLKPDMIILSTENTALRQSLSVPVLIVDHRTLSGVLDSYCVIGEIFGEDILSLAQKKQQELIHALNEWEAKTMAKTNGRKPIRTLISIDRSYGTGKIQNLFVAGADSFLSEAVARAGGENVASSIASVIGSLALAPQLSAEGVIHLAPDVIIDIQVGGRDLTLSESDWQSLGNSVPAVKNRRILTLTDDYASIPGPRTPMLIEKIALYFESLEL